MLGPGKQSCLGGHGNQPTQLDREGVYLPGRSFIQSSSREDSTDTPIPQVLCLIKEQLQQLHSQPPPRANPNLPSVPCLGSVSF
jgi:hypothetical protein